ncbi:MAG: S8 family peptidase [Candidatus Brocadiae bacterium]|nr:S8 family peptidase [Candidatus Brocadiia bacterium]
MRKSASIFAVLFLFMACLSFGQAILCPDLKEAMENSRDGEFRVIVEMKEQFDIDTIRQNVRNTKEAKQEIMETLKKKSNDSQEWVRNFLQNNQRFQKVEEIHSFWLVNAVSFKSNANVIRELAANEDIKGIYLCKEEQMIHPIAATSRETKAWGVKHIKADKAQASGVTGKGIVVAVVDTGVNLNHPGFAPGQVLANLGKSFVSGEADAEDGHGHGTHCAGTVASAEYGVAPDAKIVPVKVLSKSGSGSWDGVMKGVQYAAETADLMSMSLGGGASASGNVVETAVKNAIKAGIHCVIAAGNSGPNAKTIGTPGVVLEAVTVGAIDNKGVIASFSSRGPTVYNTSKPEIVAPGVNVPSLWKNGGTNTISGTSMATPHVAGLVALILSTNKSLTPEQVKALLIKTAFGTKQVNVYGDGCVDADASTK